MGGSGVAQELVGARRVGALTPSCPKGGYLNGDTCDSVPTGAAIWPRIYLARHEGRGGGALGGRI